MTRRKETTSLRGAIVAAGLVMCLLHGAGSAAQDTTLTLKVDMLHFFVDNEYQAEKVDGYTLPGFGLRPRVVWKAARGLTIEGGLHWLHYWGAAHYPAVAAYTGLPEASDTTTLMHVVPWMQARVGLTKGVDLVMGSLENNGGHGLPLPMYNPEYRFCSDPEAGVQMIADLNWITGDLWVNWTEMIFRRSRRQERFTAGGSARLHVARWKTGQQEIYADLLMHGIAQHIGGEMLADTLHPQNKLNYALGGAIGYRSGSWEAELSSRTTGYHQHGDSIVAFKNGRGLWSEARVRWRGLKATAGYWVGEQYVPLLGSYHFSNMSGNTPDLHFDRCHMAVVCASYDWRVCDYAEVILAGQYYHYFPYTGDRDDPAYPAKVIRDGADSFGIGIFINLHPTFILKK